ncbi:MAG: hypothetical protein ACP5D1_10375 [Bacteroidales bacterium]
MITRPKGIFLFIVCGLMTFMTVMAQETNDTLRKNAINVFIDCFRCDMNYIREEIPYVNYVRDVKEADVYILETRQSTGSGGSAYNYIFSGRGKYTGMNDTLVYSSRPDDSSDHTRRRRTETMKMGLMRYVARTPLASRIQISHSDDLEEEEVTDKWNFWVFELETNPRFEWEELSQEVRLRNSISANKVTPEWKIEFDFDHDLSVNKYTYDDTTFVRDKSSARFDNLVVKSINDHWSAGLRMDISRSTFSNYLLNYNIDPSLEYNIYPYSEATHRQLRILYGFGHTYSHYIDTTIYNLISESRLRQELRIAYKVQDQWGSVNVSMEASNYMHDLSKNRIELGARIHIRITKGLSFSLFGGVARIRDQLSLAKGELSEADILLRLQELATGYRIDGGLGITYTFGSIYNNVVNPRFGSRYF